MNINEIQKIVSGLTEDEFETLKIEQNLFHKATGLSDFNTTSSKFASVISKAITLFVK